MPVLNRLLTNRYSRARLVFKPAAFAPADSSARDFDSPHGAARYLKPMTSRLGYHTHISNDGGQAWR